MNINQYYHISKIKGRIKGILGELLFMDTKKNVYSTKFFNPNFLDRFPFDIPSLVLDFLKENWYTIDCFEFILHKDQEEYSFLNLILYEVKFMNYYGRNAPKHYNTMKFTSSQIEVYKKAQNLGITVKIVKMQLFEGGKYLINILDFNNQKYKYKICNGSKSFQKTF